MLKVTCGQEYPGTGPIVQFLSKINLTFVNQSNGKVGEFIYSIIGANSE